MNKILWLDFETRSRCNLLEKGAYNYALDPSTEVLCMSYAFDDGEVRTWVPPIVEEGYNTTPRLPASVVLYLLKGGQIRAHNAAFERLIFWYVLGIKFKLEQSYCTATEARANCAPGNLEDVGRFCGAGMRKDFRGKQLIKALCVPRPDGTFNEDPALMQEMIKYCEQDVRAMRDISSRMRQLSDEELHDYHVNERINDRGVLVDLELCKAAQKYAAAELEEVQALVKELTRGVITSVRSRGMTAWVAKRVGPEALKLMELYKDGEKKLSCGKEVRANLLALADEDADQVPNDVADVVQCADDVWASSTAKFKRLQLLSDDEDSRVRGAFVFAGGSATGRASSYGAQVHNFTRQCAKQPDAVCEAMVKESELTPVFGSSVSEVLKGMLRPALIPAKGKQFVVADWSSIEARINPWLSMDVTGNDVLEVFRQGKDLYVVEAAKIFRIKESEVTKDQRQIGKIAVLALGYQGAVGAFQKIGKTGMNENEIRRIVNAWRRANPWAVNQWRDMEAAAFRAVRNRGSEINVNRITYYYDGKHLWYALPSGRILCYPFAKVDEEGISYAKAAWKPKADAKEWPRAHLYGGLMTENVTQAVANDILRYSLRQLEPYGAVLHVHDEIVLENVNPHIVEPLMESVMTTPPAWCSDLPLAVEIKTMGSYGK